MEYEWNDDKANANWTKHGIDFADAIRVFEHPTLQLPSDRGGETRWKAIGFLNGLAIAVVYTLRGGSRRIISARRARQNERDGYDHAHPGR